jgi:hypothetical protein
VRVERVRGPKALSRSPTFPPRSEQGLLFPSVRVKGRTGLPLRPRQALPAHGQAAGGAGAPCHRDDDVLRDGHALLAGAGRGGNVWTGLMAMGADSATKCHDQNPRFQPWRKPVILRGLSSFVGECPKGNRFEGERFGESSAAGSTPATASPLRGHANGVDACAGPAGGTSGSRRARCAPNS